MSLKVVRAETGTTLVGKNSLVVCYQYTTVFWAVLLKLTTHMDGPHISKCAHYNSIHNNKWLHVS